MGLTMNKAVPWNIKGVAYDSREAARIAAGRAGVTVGEWLSDVIAERAQELGVAVRDVPRSERIDALAASLAGVAESNPYREDRARPDVETAEKAAEPASTTDESSMNSEEAESRRAVANEGAGRPGRRPRGSSAHGSRSLSRASARSRSNSDLLEQWEHDSLLDEALDLAERRAAATRRHEVMERERQAVAALSREAERLNHESQAGWDRSYSLRETRRPARDPAADAASQQVRDAVGAVAARLEELESRVAHRYGGESSSRRSHPGLHRHAPSIRDLGLPDHGPIDALPETPVVRSRKSSEIERIDKKLASILGRFEAPYYDRPEHAAPGGRWHGGGESPSSLLAEIARRQAALDASASGRKGDLLSESSYATMSQAQADLRAPFQPAPPATSPGASSEPREQPSGPDFAALQEAFSALASRLEARLDTALASKVEIASGRESLANLETGFANLEKKIEDLQERESQDHGAAAVVAGLETLRSEITSISGRLADLAAQQSAPTLENAIRTLSERMDRSRIDGVSEAVLAPIARLSVEIGETLRANDPQAALQDIRNHLKEIESKVEGVAVRDNDPGALATLQALADDLRVSMTAVAEQSPQRARIEEHFAELASRIEHLADEPPRKAMRALEQSAGDIRQLLVQFSPAGLLQDLSQKLDSISDRMVETEERSAAPTAMFDDLSRQLDEAHASLSEQISAKMAESPAVDLRPLEAMIGGLSGKIDGLRQTSGDMQALGGLVRGLAAQIEDARLPNADALVLDSLEHQVTRLAEKLDRSDASLDAIVSLERLLNDLFRQMEDTRLAAIEAAENSARTVAENANRGQIGAEPGGEQVIDRIAQELSEFRKAQQSSDQRVHSTLLALNQTLERMVDRIVTAGPSLPAAPSLPVEGKIAQAPIVTPFEMPLEAAPVRDPHQSLPVDDRVEVAPIRLEAPRESFNPDAPIKQLEDKRLPAFEPMAPAVELGRGLNNPTPTDVSPLIAAARRAAQAAQASAATASKTVPRAQAAGQVATRKTLFAQKRRPILLGLAAVVLLVGALQLVRLQKGQDLSAVNSEEVTGSINPTAAVQQPSTEQDAALSPAPTAPVSPPQIEGTTAEPATVPPAANVAALETKASAAPSAMPVPTASIPLDAALTNLPSTLKEAAASGDAPAQFEVGARLAQGRGVARDLKAAAVWFERAAKQGLAPAQYRMGSIYEKGVGVAVDAAAAVSWYERAAAQGNVRAMHNLGVMSAEGAGAKPDYAKASTWFSKAADFGVRDSQFNLGILDARGLGVQQNLPQSYTWFSIAAAQGDADAARKRDDVAGKLDARALEAAKAAAAGFKPKATNQAANEVAVPSGGWDAVAAKTPAPDASPAPKSAIKMNM